MVARRHSRWYRSLVAATTAYVLVLQMLLTGVAAAEMAASTGAADPFVICHSDAAVPGADEKNTGAPTSHATCILCTLATVAVPGGAAAGPTLDRVRVDAAFRSAMPPRAVGHDQHDPRCSQGPPYGA
jgi:hypothetical protein